MKRYTKSDVLFHDDGFVGDLYPAVNVKVYKFPCAEDVAKEFGFDMNKAQSLLDEVWAMTQETFWDSVQHIAEECLGEHVEAHAAGRSDGWVVVRNLETFENWDCIDLMKWRHFEEAVKKEVKYLTSWDWVKHSCNTILS